MMLREQLEEVMSGLMPREQQVLRLRFGLDDGRAHWKRWGRFSA